MEFRILGPLEVVDGERPVPLGGAKQRALLAALLLRAGEVVSTDRLIDDLWVDGGPPTARQTVQVYVSQLRKALGDGMLQTQGRGYVLDVVPGCLDSERFEELLGRGREALAEARPVEAAELLRAALALWRGPPLSDLAYEPFVQAEIARLDERRIVCLEERIDADLALGRHGDLVGELEGLISAHPLRERFRAQLMLALYRSGRQAEALDVYQVARRTFAEEVGLEPSPLLKDLERKILRQDPELAPPSPAAVSRSSTAGRRRPWLLAAAGALLLAGGLAVALVQVLGSSETSLESVAANAVGQIDPAVNAIAAQVPVGAAPGAVAVGEGAVWVLNSDDRTISRIDPETKAVRTFATGATPTDLTVGGGSVWVGNGEPTDRAQFLGAIIQSVTRFDPVTATPRATIALPQPSIGLDPRPYDQLVFARGSLWAINGDASIVRIDSSTNRVAATIDGVTALALATDGRSVWALTFANELVRISPRTNRVTARIAVKASGLEGIAVGGGAVWATSPYDGTVWRIDVGADVVQRTIPVAPGAHAIAYGAGSVWAANAVRGTLTRIDPGSNRVVASIAIGNTPTAVAVDGTGAWVSVVGVAGEPAPAAAGSAAPGFDALPVSSCSRVFAGTQAPDLLIASDFPLQGGLRFSTVQMVEAIQFVLRQRAFRAGPYNIAYQSCDDSIARTGLFDDRKCIANARAYARNHRVVGVIGPVNSFCALEQIPILNAAAGGPLAMVSPLASLPGLTRQEETTPRGGVASLYPSGRRNFARVYPSDDQEAAALAMLARDLGAERVAVAYAPDDPYSESVAIWFRNAARALGLDVAVFAAWDPAAKSYGELAERIADAEPDAVYLGGLLDQNGGLVLRDVRAELGPDVPVLLPAGFTPISLLVETAGEHAEGAYVGLAGMPVLDDRSLRLLPPAARDFLRGFGGTRPGAVEPSAFYAAQAAEVLLDAIARSDGTRASVLEALFATEVEGGILGSFRFDANGDTTLNPVSIYRVVHGRGANEIQGVEGGVLERVIVPPAGLVDE